MWTWKGQALKAEEQGWGSSWGWKKVRTGPSGSEGTGRGARARAGVAIEPASHASPTPTPSWESQSQPGGGKEARGHKLSHCTSSNLDHDLVSVVCIISVFQMEKLRGRDLTINIYLSQEPNQVLRIPLSLLVSC